VPKEESIHQNVIVHTDLIITDKSVLVATTNVLPVPKLLTLVLIVPKTEKEIRFAIAQKEPMITVLHSVQIVTINVLPVTTCQTIVSLVLKEESIHQSVIFQNQLFNQLMLMISQSDLLKLLIVTVDVKLVKDSELTV
jgi:hypothetical protein